METVQVNYNYFIYLYMQQIKTHERQHLKKAYLYL